MNRRSYRDGVALSAQCLFLSMTLGLILLSSSRTAGSDCTDYGDFVRVIGQVASPDKARDIAVVGDTAYVAAGWGYGAGHFYVLDISNPYLPRIVGGFETPGVATGVVCAGSYAYVSHQAGGVLVVDVSVPGSPVIAASCSVSNPAQCIALSGTYLYVGCSGSQGNIQVVDIANPLSPVVIGELSFAWSAIVRDIAVKGTLACVACPGLGLAIADISSPAAPSLLGYSTVPATGVAVSGDWAFVCFPVSGWPEMTSHVGAVAIADPRAPHLVDYITVPGEGYTQDVEVVGEYAFASDEASGLHIIDVADPAALTRAGWLQFGRAMGSVAAGGLLYVAAWDAACVVDISNPESPVPIGGLDTPGIAWDVDVAGSFAYIADDGALRVIDVSNPAAPSLAGWVNTPGGAQAVEVVLGPTRGVGGDSGSYAYVADGVAGLQVIDVGSPAAPRIVGSVDTPSGARGVAVSGDIAYVADSFAGLQVVDVSDRSAPTIIGNVVTFRARGVAARDAYVYIADAENGLQIVDVADPTGPVLLGRADTPGFVERVVLAGDLAFVAAAAAGGGVYVIDISDAAAPALVGTLPRMANDVEVTGSLAYAAGGPNGLHVLDISDPTSPGLIGSATTEGGPMGIALSGDLVFIADVTAGLVIMPAQCPSTTGLGGGDSPAVASVRIVAQPNPAPGRTTFAFDVPAAGRVQLEVYDIGGRLVRKLWDGWDAPGGRLLRWDGHDARGRQVPCGVYSVMLHSTAGSVTGHVVMLDQVGGGRGR